MELKGLEIILETSQVMFSFPAGKSETYNRTVVPTFTAMLWEILRQDQTYVADLEKWKKEKKDLIQFPARIPWLQCKSCFYVEVPLCTTHGIYQKEVKDGLGCAECDENTSKDIYKDGCRHCKKQGTFVAQIINMEYAEIEFLLRQTFGLVKLDDYKGGYVLCNKVECRRCEFPGQDDDDHGIFFTLDGPNNLKCHLCKMSTRTNDQWRNGCRYCLCPTSICPSVLNVAALNVLKSLLSTR